MTGSPDNRFFTCSIALQMPPEVTMKGDPPCMHSLDEAISKMDRFCHHIYNVPITWLCTWPALKRYGDTLARFHREYGDEIAISEAGISTHAACDGHPEIYQSWVEECGLKRPDQFASKEPELVWGQGFHDMSYEDIVTALTYLKKCYDTTIGQKSRTLANPHIGAATIRAMEAVGLDISWAYNWNYFCEGINNKGCLLQPFYVAQNNHNLPEPTPGEKTVLATHWGSAPLAVMQGNERHSRLGMPGYCLNALEMTNRSEGLDKFDMHRNVIAEWLGQSKWNPYALIPLQLEGLWISEDEYSPELYDQFPNFNPANTEIFYTQIETALRHGAKPMTLSGFADWHKANIKDTVPMVHFSEDPVPDVRGKGKDQAYQPLVVYGDKERQYWFSKSRGFNYIRKYVYTPPLDEKDVPLEYPFVDEPQVYLEIKRSVNMRAGITLTPDHCCYDLTEFDLTAYRDDPDYAAIIWQANIPPYVKDSDIITGGAITGFKTIRDKNAAIVFANLKQGLNKMEFKCDLPNNHVRIKSCERIGKRFEIWIENDSDEVFLHDLTAKLDPGLRIGGFWWDGYYSRTIFRYGWGAYDRDTGLFELRILYPIVLKVNHGLTRVSVELL